MFLVLAIKASFLDCFITFIASLIALEFNGLATARLVNACELQGVKKFIYLSTAHVYDTPLVGKFTENTLPKNKHPYATSSLAGENAVLKVEDKGYCLDRMVLRLSNAVGPPIHKGANCWMLIANELCREIVKQKQITIKANRKNKRDFFPISLLLSTISSLLGFKEFRHPIMNVCSSISLSLEGLANLLSIRAEQILGFKPSIRYNEVIKNWEEQELYISSARLRSMVNIKNGLEKEIDDLLLFCKYWF